jgi:hypothetical protein
LNTENYKTLVKELTDDLNKRKVIIHSWIGGQSYWSGSIPQSNLQSNAIPRKIPTQEVEHLPCKPKALSSIPSMTAKKGGRGVKPTGPWIWQWTLS